MTGLLERVGDDQLAPARPDLAALVHWAGAATQPIHRWFRYREGFSPALITELGLGHRILDPFCGSGSIMVGAAQQGRASVGIDVNPLAAFVSRVKLSPLGDADVVAAAAFLDGFEAAVACVEPWPTPALRIASKVFEAAHPRRRPAAADTDRTTGHQRRGSATSCSSPGWRSSRTSAATSRKATASSTATASAARTGTSPGPTGSGSSNGSAPIRKPSSWPPSGPS